MKIQFKTDNAAFEENRELEVADILKRIAYRVEEGATEGVIMDSNGNKVGHWSY